MRDIRSDIERHDKHDTLNSLPHATLRDGTRVVALIEPRRPYLVLVRGSPESSSAVTVPTAPSGTGHQGDADSGNSPTTGRDRLITAEKLRALRTTD